MEFTFLVVLLAGGATQEGLTWQAADDCPSRVEIERRTLALIGTDVSEAAEGLPTAQVRIEKVGARYVARVELALGGLRTLEGPDCNTLTSAVALVLSLEASPRRSIQVEAARSELHEPTPPALHGWVSASGSALFGVLAEPAGRARLGVALEHLGLRAALAVSAGPGQSRLGTPRAGAGAFIALPVAVEVWACVLVAEVRFAPRVCLGLQGGVLTATGLALARSSSGDAPWLAPLAGAELELPLTKLLRLRLELAVGFNAIRPRVVTTTDTIYQPAWVLGQGSLGLAVRFF